MEVKNNPFYELRSRLYATAAAGCSLIAEDFRLSRAIEAFRPMSEANKVFGKLCAMCDSLVKSQDPASDITDCIALADALAVTQGTFADSSVTEKVPVCSMAEPAHLSFTELELYKEKIGKTPYTEVDFDKRFFEVASDPRLLSSVIGVAGRNGSGTADFIVRLGSVYGEKFYTLLLDSLDLSNKNATGNQIRYVSSVTHGLYNDRYIKLAENEDAPQGIRIAATEAMAWTPSNEEKLLSIYRTSKSKIKNAALLSLAKINSNAVADVVAKAAENPKSTDFDLLCVSGSRAAADFARRELDFMAGYSGKEAPPEHPFISYRFNGFMLLSNKTDVADAFEKWAERHTGDDFVPYDRGPDFTSPNEPLIMNLFEKQEPEYRDMVRKLHGKYPVQFALSGFLLALMEDPENACRKICTDHRIYDRDLFHFIQRIFHTPDGWYGIRRSYCADTEDFTDIKLFRSIPDDMLGFLSDTSVVYPSDEMEKIFPKGVDRSIASENMKQREYLLRHILSICSDEDRERVSAAQEKFTDAMNRRDRKEEDENKPESSPYGGAYNLLMHMIRNDMPPEFAFMIERSTLPVEEKIIGLKQALIDIEKEYPDSLDEFKANIRQKLEKLGAKE